MTGKPKSRPSRTSTPAQPRTSTKARPTARATGASAARSSTRAGAASEASRPAGKAESWRSRTGAAGSKRISYKERDRLRKERLAKPRPARISRPLSRPAVGAPELTADFEALVVQLSAAGLELKPAEREGLLAYGRFLVERAGTLNLISQVDRPRFFTRHLFECLIPGLVLHARRSHDLIDIGSGGGLPGIPLAIVAPELRVTLVEPRQRKVQFLEAVLLECGLSQRVRVFQGTAERYADQMVDGPVADLATARAVDRLEKVWGWALRLLIPGGWLATYKGPLEIEAELQRLAEDAPTGIEAFPCPGQPRSVLLVQTPRR